MEHVQSWLTPALLSAVLVLAGWLLNAVSGMRKELRTALDLGNKHETILHQYGMTEPRFVSFGKKEGGD